MGIANKIFDKVTYYPLQLVRPIKNEDFDNATSADKTWRGRAVAQAAIGVRAGILALPIAIAFAASTALWLPRSNMLPELKPLPNISQRYLLLWACVGAPIGEEIVFRGIVQTTLKHSARQLLGDTENAERNAKIVGVFLSAIIFGGVHGGQSQAVSAMFAGLYLGYLKERTKGSLWAPIAAHATHNTIVSAIQLIALGRILS
jgi:membrane protease YdiL (CAAX protease family)